MNSGAASPRSRRALRPVHWRWQIAIAGRRCEISKALRQRSSAIRFPACQRSIGENANGLTERGGYERWRSQLLGVALRRREFITLLVRSDLADGAVVAVR